MSDKKIPLLTSEREIEVLKKVFAVDDGDKILLSVRSLLLGFNITKAEADVIKAIFSDQEVLTAFRKKLYPILSADSLIGQGGDFWYGTDTQVVGRDPSEIRQVMESKSRTLKLLEQAMNLLTDPSGEKIDLSFEIDFTGPKSEVKDPYAIGLITRNRYVHSVAEALSMVKAVAGLKNETAEQTKKRLLSNESK